MEFKETEACVGINGDHIRVIYDSAVIDIKRSDDPNVYVSHLWYLDDCLMAILKAKDVVRNLLEEESRSCDES